MTAGEKILRKALAGSGLDSRQWNSVQAGLRDRAFFSSRVAELRVLEAFRAQAARHAGGAADISRLRMELRGSLEKAGVERGGGGIRDLYSKARLDVMLKTNAATARGFVRWAAAMSPGAYAAFPAREFLRVRQTRRQRRDWPERWRQAGGRLFGGRMVALKDDPVWQRLGDAGPFGNPYPPFDWGSGMGVADVRRSEAVALGLTTDGQVRARRGELERRREEGALPGMNGSLRAEIPMRHDSDAAVWLRGQFGDQIRFDGDMAVWQGEAVREVLEGRRAKARLGEATPDLLGMLKGVATPDEFAALAKMNPSFNRDTFARHAAKHYGANETRLKDNVPLGAGDYELMPSVWRRPDRVIPVKPGHVVLELETLDGCYLQLALSSRTGFTSYYKTKMPLGTAAGNNSRNSSGGLLGRLGPTAAKSVPQTPGERQPQK